MPLADLLVEHGWLSPQDRALVDSLLERKVHKHAGDAQASLAAVARHRRASAGRPRSPTRLRRSGRPSALMAGPKMHSSSCPPELWIISRAQLANRSRPLREAWEGRFSTHYRAEHPELARQLDDMLKGALPYGWDHDIPGFPPDATGIASRDAGGKVLNAIAHNVSALVGGAADLAPSTKTRLTFEGAGDLEAQSQSGRNMHFGVREHAMGAIANGMALSYLRPFTATFLVFSDETRPPIRLAAIMELPTIFVFSQRIPSELARTGRRTNPSNI